MAERANVKTVSEAKADYHRALLLELDYCQTMKKDERAAAIQAELDATGYKAPKSARAAQQEAAADSVQTTDGGGELENTDAQKAKS